MTLSTRADLLVLDEPMSGLDPHARFLVRQELAARRADGCSVLISSHELAELAGLVDRVAQFDDGRLISCAGPGELGARHGSLEAAFLAAIADKAVGGEPLGA